jgi:pyruvate dehydrogenase E2 component (dihydrolipoamide acetyltransferase)
MRALRAILSAAALVMLLPATAALAQTPVDPSVTPEINTGGWVHGMAILFGAIGVLVLLMLVAAYIRYAPRFSTDESTLKVVRADRVRPGEELPRRTVDIKAAAPMVVAPPPLPQPAGVAASAPAAAAAATPAAAAPAPAPAPAPAAEAPSPEAPQEAPASEEAPAEAAQAQPAPADAPPPPAPPPAERVEVALDQEVFDQTLKELLDKGTDKRVAEGQARRAAMIAARKKAAGEA